jgi:hypothetical protein
VLEVKAIETPVTSVAGVFNNVTTKRVTKMPNWSDGYVTDTNYTYGYYPDLNPLRAQIPLLRSGYSPGTVLNACELGFGQGVSIGIHSAASNVQWFGTDFNPEQTGYARNFITEAQSGGKLYDQSFEEFCSRDDLPEFDYICLHGIWSWISEGNRRIILDFLRKKLKVGGVLNISYNVMPGWSSIAPVRELMLDHALASSLKADSSTKALKAALDYLDTLSKVNPAYLQNNPGAVAWLADAKEKDPVYLAHELMNKDWQATTFSRVEEALKSAKLSFACSAAYIDHVDALNVTTEQKVFLESIQDRTLRETTRDMLINRRFRRDYWVKGPQIISKFDELALLRKSKIVLTQPRSLVSFKVNCGRGEASIPEAKYKSLLDYLADYQTHTIGEIELALVDNGYSISEIVDAIHIFVATGDLQMASDDCTNDLVNQRCRRLNKWLCELSRGDGSCRFLSSPVTGGGIGVSRFNQLFLLAVNNGLSTPQECADSVWEILSAQGQRLTLNGRMLETKADNLQELTRQAEVFMTLQLPVLEALGVSW